MSFLMNRRRGVGKVCNNGTSGLPLDYTLLEYIESTNTAYIDTGLKNSDIDEYYLKFKSQFYQYKTIFGNYVNENTECTRLLFAGTNDGLMYSNVGSTAGQASKCSGYIADDWNEAWGRKSGYTTYFKLNASPETSRDFNAGNTNTGIIRLFMNYNPAQIARIQFKKNGVLVFNGIPAKNSSNVVGMYDLVSRQFFTNRGTGTFTAGDPVPRPC